MLRDKFISDWYSEFVMLQEQKKMNKKKHMHTVNYRLSKYDVLVN